jgi:hypothetical protein
MNLPRQRAELLGSRLQEWNLLTEGTSITKRCRKLPMFNGMLCSLCVRLDIGGLMKEVGFECKAKERILFIDSY